jgi:hypothetical protein
MPSHTFEAAFPGRVSTAGLFLLTRFAYRFGTVRRKLAILNECVNHWTWLRSRFGRIDLYARRESLWKLMIDEMKQDRWVVYEFGVAWGYTTNFWLARAGSSVVEWHGFDRFTGLPRGWRELPAGVFDAGGNPPPIDDDRVRWHVGDVESTLPAVAISNHRKCIIFDLDIYEPTAFVWNCLRSSLAPGDLLYFDESFDHDERKVIEHHVMNDFRIEPIACTPLASCFRLAERVAQEPAVVELACDPAINFESIRPEFEHPVR